MPFDALMQLQASNTATATKTSTSVDLKAAPGTPRRGLPGRLLVNTVSGTSPTLDFKIQHSVDNTTFTDLLTLPNGQVTAAGEYSFLMYTPNQYVRALATIGGTNPSFVYQVDIGAGIP